MPRFLPPSLSPPISPLPCPLSPSLNPSSLPASLPPSLPRSLILPARPFHLRFMPGASGAFVGGREELAAVLSNSGRTLSVFEVSKLQARTDMLGLF